MLPHEVAAIVKQITYKPGWDIIVTGESGSDRLYVQLSVDGPEARDSTDPSTIVPWKSGKRYLSPHMCRQEIVGAVFGLIKDAEEHETREWFRYRGASIFNPHLDPDVLADIAKMRSSFNVRENAMSMQETT